MISNQLPGKVKASLRQFCVDLKETLWFVGSVGMKCVIFPGRNMLNVKNSVGCKTPYWAGQT